MGLKCKKPLLVFLKQAKARERNFEHFHYIKFRWDGKTAPNAFFPSNCEEKASIASRKKVSSFAWRIL